MNRFAQLFLIAVGVMGLLSAGYTRAETEMALELPDPAEMTFEPLNFSTIEPDITSLDNGIEFWKIADHTLPIVTLAIYINAGISSEPADKGGIGQLTASTLVRGGTESMTPEAFNREAELSGITFGSKVQPEFTKISVQCLVQDVDKAMSMLMDLIKNPRFDETELKLVQSLQTEEIRRTEQVPFFQVFNTIRKRIYGENHPNSRVPDVETLNKLTRDDLLAFHSQWYHPNICRFAVIGAADDTMCNTLKESIATWKGNASDQTTLPDPSPVSDTRTIIMVDRPGTQTIIGMAHLSVGPAHPQRPALEVFNSLYGGSGLGSRLMNEVRTQKGLAYVVFGSHMFDTPRGIFVAGCMTKNESVVDAIQTMIAVTEKMQTEPVSTDELGSVIQSMENSFIFKFERPRRVLQRMLEHKRMGLPDDYLTTYLEKIRKVTPESIQALAAESIDLDKLQIVVSGPVDQLKPELEKLGWPIEVVDND